MQDHANKTSWNFCQSNSQVPTKERVQFVKVLHYESSVCMSSCNPSCQLHFCDSKDLGVKSEGVVSCHCCEHKQRGPRRSAVLLDCFCPKHHKPNQRIQCRKTTFKKCPYVWTWPVNYQRGAFRSNRNEVYNQECWLVVRRIHEQVNPATA